ncbi:2-oxoglutarate dehydrogenase, E2 component, dihydrolipoamide succinyltransferase, partial [Arthrobacter sp. LAPM80]|uniref:2-oxoglutarate dehydrogenase, E2 component, dihydrolipoamide succinyltransferase n=1 Tax=Arthrobacter sp. LAPM80 TaxID=3141788 RepID=UPI00398A7AEF
AAKSQWIGPPMSESLLLPALGESVTEGTVTRWLKSVGDSVAFDEPLVEVSTEKVDTEIPSPFEGILQSILVPEDQTAEVGAVLAIITPHGAAPVAEAPVAEAPVAEATAPVAALAPAPAASSNVVASGNGSYFTPLVRQLARQHKVDLSAVTGTGIGGRIRGDDVRAAAAAQSASAVIVSAAPTSAPAKVEASASTSLRGTTVKASRIRAVIAKRMRESLDTSTQLTQVHEVDVTNIVRLRGRAKGAFAAAHGVNLTYLPFIALAVAEALKAFPMLNASFDEAAGTISYHDAEHLAFAVDAPKGLLVPVVRNAGEMNLAGLAAGIADVAARTRDGSIKADELSGGTFSITNIGSVGALFDTPIINAPQVGILGVGAIVKRPAVVTGPEGDDVLAIRHMMYLCLTYDHRLVDGADAGRFLQTVTARLSSAAFEGDLGL